MPLFWLILIVLAIAAVGYVLGRSRALSCAGGELSALHSLPSYYGANVAMKVVVPAFLLLIVWLLAQPFYVNSVISDMIPETAIEEGSSRGLVLAEVRRAARGLDNAVATGAMTEEFARNARADFADISTRLREAGQIVTSEITQPILRLKVEAMLIRRPEALLSAQQRSRDEMRDAGGFADALGGDVGAGFG